MTEPNCPTPHRIPRSHLVILFGMVAVYTALVTSLCQLRFDGFNGGAFDLGVNQQLLWTGSHGYLLYETPDYVTTGIHSFLEIHSTYVAFLVAPLYAALPYPGTLFAIESAAVGSAVFPLYLIARHRGVAPSLVFPFLLLFLASFAVLSALLFDFHWEAFLPTELLWFYFLVRRKSYLIAALPMVLGFLTLEIFPILVGGVVLLCLSEKVYEIGARPEALFRDRDVRVQLVFGSAAGVAFGAFLLLEHLVIPTLVGTSGVTGVYAGVNPSYAVLVTPDSLDGSAVYWFLLLASLGFLPVFSPKSLLPSLPWFVESVVLQPYYSHAFGNQYALIAISALTIAYVEGFAQVTRGVAHPRRSVLIGCAITLGVAASNVLAFGSSALLLSARAGLPLILPALAILLLFVLLSVLLHATPRGRQTDRAPIGPAAVDAILLALVTALCSILLFDSLCLILPYSVYFAPPFVWLTLLVPPLCAVGLFLIGQLWSNSGSKKMPALASLRPLSNVRIRRSLGAAALVLILGFNLAMSPLNPVNVQVSGRPGYEMNLSSNAVSADMNWIVDHIPADSVVLAVSHLFPFTADNPNAWPALSSCINGVCSPSHLPFNASHLPQFVLTDSIQWDELPTFVQTALLNTSIYGLVAEIYSTSVQPGSVYLFERAYQGVPQYCRASPVPPPYFGSAWDLPAGPSGSVVQDNLSRFGFVIESRNTLSVIGNESPLWNNTMVLVVPGMYSVTYNLTGTSRFASSQPRTPVLQLNLGPGYLGPGSTVLSTTVTAGELNPVGWSEYRLLVAFVGPFQSFETQGLLDFTQGESNGNVTLNFIEIAAY